MIIEISAKSDVNKINEKENRVIVDLKSGTD